MPTGAQYMIIAPRIPIIMIALNTPTSLSRTLPFGSAPNLYLAGQGSPVLLPTPSDPCPVFGPFDSPRADAARRFPVRY